MPKWLQEILGTRYNMSCDYKHIYELLPQDKTPGQVHSDHARSLLPTILRQHPDNDRIY